MIFSLVFISYELATMGPGDNIAYKLGAAASKKNQVGVFKLSLPVVHKLVLLRILIFVTRSSE